MGAQHDMQRCTHTQFAAFLLLLLLDLQANQLAPDLHVGNKNDIGNGGVASSANDDDVGNNDCSFDDGVVSSDDEMVMIIFHFCE
jgi:hypothetical protein